MCKKLAPISVLPIFASHFCISRTLKMFCARHFFLLPRFNNYYSPLKIVKNSCNIVKFFTNLHIISILYHLPSKRIFLKLQCKNHVFVIVPNFNGLLVLKVSPFRDALSLFYHDFDVF